MKRVRPEGHPLKKYYRWQARIYDASRWLFLFGRGALIEKLADDPSPARILEVGCGPVRTWRGCGRRFPGQN